MTVEYVKCVGCCKEIRKGDFAIFGRGYTGCYCSWRCAALSGCIFKEKILDDNTVKDAKDEFKEKKIDTDFLFN